MTENPPAKLIDPWTAVHDEQPMESTFYVNGTVELMGLGVTATLEQDDTTIIIPEHLALRVRLKPLGPDKQNAAQAGFKQTVRFEIKPYQGDYQKVLVSTEWGEQRELTVETVV